MTLTDSSKFCGYVNKLNGKKKLDVIWFKNKLPNTTANMHLDT
jgi:hypothetical protein